MIEVSWLLFAVQVLAAVVLVAVMLAVVGKGQGRRSARREAARVAVVRPLVVRLLAGDPVPAWPGRRLGRTAERLLLESLGTFRGEAREALVVTLAERGVLARARGDTSSWRPRRRAWAAQVLGRAMLADAVPDLERLLADRRTEIRLTAAQALGRIGTAEAADAVLRVMAREASVPADVAAMALVAVGPPASGPLIAALTSDEPLVRLIACRVLGYVEALEAVEALETALIFDSDPVLRAAAADSLGRIGAPSARHALEVSTRASVPDPVRVAATTALGRLGNPASVDVLLPLVAEPGYEVPHRAASALASLGRHGREALHRTALGGPPAAPHAVEALAVAALAESTRRSSARGA